MLRQTKVQDLSLLAVGDKDVCRLNVAMNDALGVSRVQSVGDLNRQTHQLLNFYRVAVDAMLQGLAFEKLHGDEMPAIRLPNLVNRADIGMVQCRRSTGFPLKTLQG